MIQLFTVWTFS